MAITTRARGCQFHGGRTDDRGFLVYCGKPVRPGYSYCDDHYRLIYQRAPVISVPRAPVAEAAGEEAAEAASARALEESAA